MVNRMKTVFRWAMCVCFTAMCFYPLVRPDFPRWTIVFGTIAAFVGMWLNDEHARLDK